MAKSKFTIEGDIENNANYAIVNNFKQDNKYKLNLRISIFIIIFLIVCVFYFVVMFYKAKETNKQMNDKINKAESLIQENSAYKEANDTLQKKLLRLKRENDILSENNDSAKGVFFEVQIGNFTEFNIDEYVMELRNLRQEKTETGNKLCIGRFRSYRKALLFENDIKKMGFTNAFLVGRIDGKLVDFQTAIAEFRKLNEK